MESRLTQVQGRRQPDNALEENQKGYFVLTIHNGLLGARHKKIHTHNGLALLLGTNIWGKHVLVTSCLPIGQ